MKPNRPDEHEANPRTLPMPEKPHPVESGFGDTRWSQVSNADEEELFNVLNEDMPMADLDAFTFENWSAAGTKTVQEPSSRQATGQPSDAGNDASQLFSAEVSGMAPHPTPSPLARGQGLTINVPLDKRQQRTGPAVEPSFVPSSGKLGSGSAQAQSRFALMQKLMQLGGYMYELQNLYSSEEHSSRSATSCTFPEELAGKLLQAAQEFLRSLRSFSLDDPPSSSISSSGSFLHHRGTSSSSEISDAENRKNRRPFCQHQSMSVSATRGSSSSFASLSSTWSRMSSAESPPKRGPIADKPTTLQLIANYFLLLELYLLFYNAVHDYLRSSEPSSDQRQPIWRDLSIGGTPLYQFPEYQIKMVLQVAARLLEEIENALGLTDGYRVSKRPANEGDGILGMNATAQFFDIFTSEAFTVAEPSGRGAIVRLQGLMDTLMVTLDEPLWV
ncbi:hypothetical protein VTG60DRAFT_681 [Thermothelomyces hinnuleus]